MTRRSSRSGIAPSTNNEFYVSGDVPVEALFNRVLFVESFVLLATAVAIISLIALATFRSLVAVLASFIVMAMTIAGTIAMTALVGFKTYALAQR